MKETEFIVNVYGYDFKYRSYEDKNNNFSGLELLECTKGMYIIDIDYIEDDLLDEAERAALDYGCKRYL